MQSKSASVIVLSGGTSRRFGSDKSQAKIAGKSLIAIILGSIPSEFKVVIVGEDPKIESSQYQCVLEEPIGGGPLAGFKAGLDASESELVALIATDMPFASGLVLNLINSIRVHDDAVMYVDAKGFKQPLAALYRSASVKRALADMGQLDGKSMRELISHLMVHEIEMSHEVAQALVDIDTAADLEQAIAFAAKVKDNSSL
jgi:molybdopterin-guanine dinucleotide biosynthesis protein A